MAHRALFNRITSKLSDVVNVDFIKSTKTEKGNTQVSERVVIEKIREVMLLFSWFSFQRDFYSLPIYHKGGGNVWPAQIR